MKIDASSFHFNGHLDNFGQINWEENPIASAALDAATHPALPLGVTKGTYIATGSLTINRKVWNRLVGNENKAAWELPGGNSRDRRKRRRAAERVAKQGK